WPASSSFYDELWMLHDLLISFHFYFLIIGASLMEIFMPDHRVLQ
ncbi:MAG: hypothetical protein ACJAVY_002035, partial [Marinoscillum sp.]